MNHVKKNVPTISLSMIVKNEEKFLEGCLESVAGLVDEMVIVDTGSTDSTKEIAARFGAHVSEFQWNGDFSSARNFSLSHCSCDWVLYLDADERLKEGQARMLHKLISERSVGAYNVLIENPHSLESGNSKQENAYPRLFRRLPGVSFSGKVHEQVWPSLIRQKLVIKQSALVISHLGYNQGYDIVRKKAERNLELLKDQLAEDPQDAYANFQIGNTLVMLQRYDEARPVLERAVGDVKLDRGNRASSYNLLAEIAVKEGKLTDAIQHCRKSLDLSPRQLMANWFLSLLHFDLGEYVKAVDALQSVQKLIKIPASERSNQIASDLDVQQSDLAKRFAITFEAAGRFEEAAAWYARWYESEPGTSDAIAGLLRCLEQSVDSRQGIDLLSNIVKKHSGEKGLFLPLARLYHKAGETRSAILNLDYLISDGSTDAEAYVLATRWRMELGDAEGAEKVLARSEAKGLRSFDLHKYAMQLSLHKGDVSSAFHHLELMTQTTDADLTPLKNRISALAAKMTALPSS